MYHLSQASGIWQEFDLPVSQVLIKLSTPHAGVGSQSGHPDRSNVIAALTVAEGDNVTGRQAATAARPPRPRLPPSLVFPPQSLHDFEQLRLLCDEENTQSARGGYRTVLSKRRFMYVFMMTKLQNLMQMTEVGVATLAGATSLQPLTRP